MRSSQGNETKQTEQKHIKALQAKKNISFFSSLCLCILERSRQFFWFYSASLSLLVVFFFWRITPGLPLLSTELELNWKSWWNCQNAIFFFHALSFFFKTGISLRFIVGIFFLKGRDFSFPFIPLCFVVLQMLWAANYTETYVSSQPVICAGVMDEVWRRFLK